MFKKSAIVVTIALAASISTAVIGSPAMAASPASVPGVTDSARLSTPVVVTGSVTAATGSPAAGTPVAIRVWPDSETLGKLPIGAKVPTLTIAGAVTDASGAYSLRVDPSKSFAGYADVNGLVSFDVVAGDGSASTSFAAIRSLTDLTSTTSAKLSATAAADPIDLVLPAATANKSAAAASPAAVTCSLQKLGTYGAQWVTVGETYTGPTSTATFTYTVGSSSSLGVGVSTSGSGFTASGTATASSTATIGYPVTPVNSARQWRTQYTYDKFTDLCGHIYARPTTFLGGAGIVYATTIAATHCVAQVAGSSFTKSSTDASAYSAGVAIASDIGINLTAKTGFTTTAKVKYTFSSSGHMCGTLAAPGSTPGRLAAKA